MSDEQQEHSVSNWLIALREDNDSHAAQEIWNRFQRRLIAVAMRQLRATTRAADADDAVNEAFASFYRRYEAGEYPDVKDRDGLWRMLLTITENKARKQLRKELALKRGAGAVRGHSIFRPTPGADAAGGFERFASAEPTPEDAIALSETMQELFDQLSEEEKTIVTLRMQSYSNAQIAERTSLSLATVERRLKRVRAKWSTFEEADE